MLYYWLVSTMYVHTTRLNWWTIQDSWILQVGHSRGIPCYPHPPHSHYPGPLPAFPSVRSRAKNCAFGGLKPPETSILFDMNPFPRSCSTPRRNHGLVRKLRHLLRPSKGCLNIRGMRLFGWVSQSVSHSVPWKITIALILVSSFLPSGVKHGKTRIDFDEMFPRCQFFTRGFPASHAWWSHQSLINPLFVIQLASSSQVLPRAEEKRPDLSCVGGRMKHILRRFPKYSQIPQLWIDYRCKKQHILASGTQTLQWKITHLVWWFPIWINVHWYVIWLPEGTIYTNVFWWLKTMFTWEQAEADER